MLRKDKLTTNIKLSEVAITASDGLYVVVSDPFTAEALSVFITVNGSEDMTTNADKVVNTDVGSK